MSSTCIGGGSATALMGLCLFLVAGATGSLQRHGTSENLVKLSTDNSVAVKFPMCAGSEDRPPPARSSTKFVGLANQGATCYLNSLLQTCFMTPELRDALFAVGPQDMHYNGPLNGNEWLDGTSDLYMPCELQRLLAYMEAADVDGLQTDALTHSFGWSNVDSNVQQDLQELMRILFDNLEQNLPELDKNRIRSIYTFTGVQEVRCLKCQNRSVREESCGDFNITVDGFKSLTDSLNAWCAPETFSGDNKYRCDKCNAYVEARKQMRLRHLSEVMILSLGRFRYNWQIGGVREKITDRYTFPQELDFAPYLENPTPERTSTVYELFSVIIHKGGPNSGHYHAIIKDIHSKGVWEAAVARAQESTSTSAWGGSGTAWGGDGAPKAPWGKMGAKLAGVDSVGGAEYVVSDYQERPELLIRDIVQQFEAMSGSVNARGMPIKQVDTEIAEQTGVAWNDKYKPMHGTIREFVESKPHLFDVNGSVVSVLDGASWDEPQQSAPRTTAQASSAPAASVWGKPDEGGPAKSWASRMKKDPIECTEKCWFDFNDMTIVPVSVKEIEKYFEGTECAYVLFYRRKSIDKVSSSGAPMAAMPCVPSHLRSEVDDFNGIMKRSRQEYSEKTNRVNVKCYPASALQFDGVKLFPNGGPFDIIIDRRNTLEQTKDALFQQLLAEYRSTNGQYGALEVNTGRQFVKLNLLRQCVAPSAAGLDDGAMHVYDLVIPEHDESAPLGTRVGNGFILLLWDGSGAAMNWQGSLVVGADSEPLALSVSYLKSLPATRETPPSVPQNPEAPKNAWGAGGASAVGIVSGVAFTTGEEEADAPPPEGVRILARKDWTLGRLRHLLAQEFRVRTCAMQDGAEVAEIVIHRLDRPSALGGNSPLRLDVVDDAKTLGALQLKEVRGCWLAVEAAPTGFGQDPRAFRAFKWTQGRLTRVYFEWPVPESSKVLSCHVDVEWGMTVQDVKRRAMQQFKSQVKALTHDEQTKLEQAGNAPGVKGAKKEKRVELVGAIWGSSGFVTVSDETERLIDMYQRNNAFDEDTDDVALPVSIKARIVLATAAISSGGMLSAATALQTGPVEVRTALVGAEGEWVSVQLLREMLLPQCRHELALALKMQHRAAEYHMCSTNWNGCPADEIEEDAMTTFGAAMHSMNIKPSDLILLEQGAPREPVPNGFSQVVVWQYTPTQRSTLVAECDDKTRSGRPDGQSFLATLIVPHQETFDMLRGRIWREYGGSLVHGADMTTQPPNTFILRHREMTGRVRGPYRNVDQTVGSRTKSGTYAGGLNVVAQILSQDAVVAGIEQDGDLVSAVMAEGSVLMHMARRNCVDRIYQDPMEVLLAAGPTPSLRDLVELASKATGIEVDDVVLAKFVITKQDNRKEWKLLEQSLARGDKKSKSNIAKILVRAAPISLNDGDVIGVKSRRDDPDARDDFGTSQGIVDKAAGGKGADKNGAREKRGETPITMTVKKPTRPSVTPGTPSASNPYENQMTPNVAMGMMMGTAHVTPPGQGYRGNMDGTPPPWPPAHSPGGMGGGGGAWGSKTTAGVVQPPQMMPGGMMGNGNAQGMQIQNGWMGGCAVPGAMGSMHMHSNGVYAGHMPQQDPEEESMISNLLTSVFPGLSQATAINVYREGVAALSMSPQ